MAVIDKALAAFLEDGVGIHIGTRNERLEPNGARAAAVVVEPDGEHVVVYLTEVAAARILPDLEANGRVALVFGRPTDERSCQVKGTFVSVRPAEPGERARVQSQWDAFFDNLGRIGVPRDNSAAWPWWPAVAIRVRATETFESSPGPAAGKRLP